MPFSLPSGFLPVRRPKAVAAWLLVLLAMDLSGTGLSMRAAGSTQIPSGMAANPGAVKANVAGRDAAGMVPAKAQYLAETMVANGTEERVGADSLIGRTSAAEPVPSLSGPEAQDLFSPESFFSGAAIQGDRYGLARVGQLPVSLEGLWIFDQETGIRTVDTSVKFPILRLFGSPPPIVSVGFGFTDLQTPAEWRLPDSLYEYTIGVSAVRPINDRWTLRTMLGVGLATDNENRSSDAWQFRGGAFGIYQASDAWQWTVGAIALGRRDLPVVPALGAIWTPTPEVRWDMIPPNPRINWKIRQTNEFVDWVYLGGGFDGLTWAYESETLGDDQLTYGDLRLVAGWNRTPPAPPGVPYVRGRKFQAEVGYAFQRELEFRERDSTLDLDDALFLRIGTSY